MNEDEHRKLLKTVKTIWDSDEYKKRRIRMARYLKYYCGYYWPETKDDSQAKESEAFANLLFSTIMTIAPLLTDNKPIWSVRTDYPFFQPIADVYKAAGDALWETEEMDAKIFEVVLDCLIMDCGIMQVSFDPDRDVGGEVSLEVTDPQTFFSAPGFEDIKDSPLCGTVTDRSIWWVRKNFPDKADKVQPDKKGTKETVPEKIRGIFSQKMDHEYLGEKVTVYTIWMRDDSFIEERNEDGKAEKKPKYPNGRLLVFTEKVVLEDKEYPYNHGRPPWVILYDYKIPHNIFGMGECQQLEGLVLEYNLNLKKLFKHTRMYHDPIWYIDAGSGVDEQQFKEVLLAPGEKVMSVNTGSPIPKPGEMPLADQNTISLVNDLPTVIQDVSGVTDVSKGMASKKQRQSAHEISALLETSYTRTRQRVRNLEAFIKRLYSLVIEIMQQFYSEPRAFSMKNQNNQTEWFEMSNSRDFAEQAMKPREAMPEKPPAAEEDMPEYNDLKQQWQDYSDLMKKVGDEKSVSFKFRVDVESNSMLPMDQQSLANLGLQLSGQGRLDTLSLLEILHWPNPEKVVERLKKEAAERAQVAQPQAPAGMPMPPQGGQNAQ